MTELDLRPVFVRLASHLRERIVNGTFLPGQLLPGEEALAREFNVSVGTVRKAFDVLSGQGLVTRHRGRGTFVSRATDERAFTSFFRLVNRSDGQRRLPVDKILLRERANADEQETSALELKSGEFVYRLRRLRLLDERPLLLETIAFPLKRIMEKEWGESDTSSHLIYSFLERQCGVSIARVEDRLQACTLPADVAEILDLPVGHSVLLVVRVAFDLENRPVEVRRSWMVTDAYDYLSELRWTGFTDSN
ncbi:GntR family transcriptional regulator [Pseudomonas silvicola]|nr:GntR family transcriptional regulator [Pseudomonas silvicola]